MATAIPLVASNANYRFGISLNDTPYLIDVRWNGREAAWYMDVSSSDDVIIRHGIKLVLGTALGARSANPDWPLGVMLMHDLSGSGVDATFEDISTRVVLLFFNAADWLYGA